MIFVRIRLRLFKMSSSVAEPLEQQLFAGIRAEVFWAGSGSGYVNSYKMLQNPVVFHTKI
jgi:hypothetical protein